MNVQEIIDLRISLVVERDALQKRIVDLYGDIKGQLAQDAISAGIFRVPWKHLRDISAYSTHADKLFIQDPSTNRVVRDQMKKAGVQDIELEPGVVLSAMYENLTIRFDTNADPGAFIRKVGLNVVFDQIDTEIRQLQDRKRQLRG